MIRRDVEDVKFNRRVGTMVGDIRRDAKMSQSELAIQMNTMQSVISEIETGRTGLTVWMLRRLARALGYTLKISFVSDKETYETT